jgi:hypothetical protein
VPSSAPDRCAALSTAALALPAHPAVRLVHLAAAAAYLRGGLPAALAVTFPWIELGRAREPEWESAALLGLALAAAASATDGWARRVGAVVAATVRAAVLLLPAKISVQTLEPARSGAMPTPVLAWPEPEPRVWGRVTRTADELSNFGVFVADEWAFMDIAGGIHQERDTTAPGPASAARRAWRFALWRGLEGVVALELGLRVLAPFAAVAVLFDRARPAARATLLAALFLVPAANLAALLAGLPLPDDGPLRANAAMSTLWLLGTFHLVARR